jgi:hypothetical protein
VFLIHAPQVVLYILRIFTELQELPTTSRLHPFLDTYLNNVDIRHIRFKVKLRSEATNDSRTARHWAMLASHTNNAQKILHDIKMFQAQTIEETTDMVRTMVTRCLQVCPSISVHIVYLDIVDCISQAIAQGFFYGFDGPPVSERERQCRSTSSSFAYRNLAIARPFYGRRRWTEFFEDYSGDTDEWIQWDSDSTRSTNDNLAGQ